MPLNTFPYLGSYGSSDTQWYEASIREYSDGTYRAYAKSSFKHRAISLVFKSISKTKRDAIEAFFNANWNLTFTLYFWPETSTVGSGPSHTARFDYSGQGGGGSRSSTGQGPELDITNLSTCTYDINIEIILLS